MPYTATRYATTQAGNFSSGSTWVGGVVPPSGSLIDINHTPFHFDVDVILGGSPHTTYQTRPTVSATGAGGALPAGAYRARLVAVSAYGEVTSSCSSLQATITSGQNVRVVIPTPPAGATGFNLYLSQAGGAAGQERRYAVNLTAGNYDCAVNTWLDAGGSAVAFASAVTLPVAQEAFISTVKFFIDDGVKVTMKGDGAYTADVQIDADLADAGFEFDASGSPSGAAIYRIRAGTISTQGTGTLISTWSGLGRPFARSASGTTPGQLSIASQTSTSGNLRMNLAGMVFENLGGSGYSAVEGFCNVASFTQQLTDFIFAADCRELKLDGVPATSGWQLTRGSFRQTAGNTYGGRTCCVSTQSGSSDANVGVTRDSFQCDYEVLPAAIAKGGATYRECYFNDAWADLSTGVGGSATSNYTISRSFVRKLMAGAGTGQDTRDVNGNTSGNYLYIDNVSGPTAADLNPHGLGLPALGTGTTRTHADWTAEYNGNDDSGDIGKSPGVAAGTVIQSGWLILPNAAGKSSGTLFTWPNNPNSGYRLESRKCTLVYGPYPGISTSEGGLQPAGTQHKLEDCLGLSIEGTPTNRFMLGKSDGNGAADTADVILAANCRNNAYWNAATGTDGKAYNSNITGTPGSGDVDLGNSNGADIATNGPKFVDPTRNFVKWCEVVLGATGTTAQKINIGLDALKAIADTTSPNHVPGLEMDAPQVWVRAGWAPTNPLLNGAASDGGTIGAIPYVAADTGEFTPSGSGGSAGGLAGLSLTLAASQGSGRSQGVASALSLANGTAGGLGASLGGVGDNPASGAMIASGGGISAGQLSATSLAYLVAGSGGASLGGIGSGPAPSGVYCTTVGARLVYDVTCGARTCNPEDETMADIPFWWIGEPAELYLTLKEHGGDPITDAEVTVQFYLCGREFGDPITLPHVSGGEYKLASDITAEMVCGARYKAHYLVDGKVNRMVVKTAAIFRDEGQT